MNNRACKESTYCHQSAGKGKDQHWTGTAVTHNHTHPLVRTKLGNCCKGHTDKQKDKNRVQHCLKILSNGSTSIFSRLYKFLSIEQSSIDNSGNHSNPHL